LKTGSRTEFSSSQLLARTFLYFVLSCFGFFGCDSNFLRRQRPTLNLRQLNLLSLSMKRSAKRKCLHCAEFYLPDRRNLHQQRYCSEPACRKQSKSESRRRWLRKQENENYFRGPENSQRVKEWRKRNPGYWRKRQYRPDEPLQDVCRAQVLDSEGATKEDLPHALQDLFLMQPAVIVGLISTMTGSALQDDIAATAQALRRKGEDILSRNETLNF
jgi:hypothetical protein